MTMKKNLKTYYHKNQFVMELLLEEFKISETGKLTQFIEKNLNRYNYPDTIFDLKNINHIDSIGIGMFLATRNIFVDHAREMVLVCPTEKVQKMFDSINMDRFCKIFTSLDEAAEYFQSKKPS